MTAPTTPAGSSSRERTDAEIARMTEAADWLQVLHTRGDDEKALEAWLDWCARDSLNRQAFDEMSAVWVASGDGRPSEAAPVWQTNPERERPRARMRPALAACVAGVIGLGLIAGASVSWKTREQARTQTFASPVGVNTRHTLEDESVLDLGGGSRATVSYSDRTRRVNLLEGEIFVTVSKDAQRPFVVAASDLEVTAVGTAFNVRRSADRTVVTVTEGIVEAAQAEEGLSVPGSRPPTRTRLHVGQELAYREDSSTFSVRWVDPAAATAWRTGVLKFIDEPLFLVISSINRYSSYEIVIEDESIGQLVFTGTARVDRIDSWLQALETVFPVNVVERPDGRRQLTGRVGSPESQVSERQ